MPEIRSPLAALDDVGRDPGDTAPAVTFREIVGWDLVQAACWRGLGAALHATVSEALGKAPPAAPGRCHAAADIEIMTVAPNRLWCLAPRGDPRLACLVRELPPETGCTTPMGHGHVRLRVGGPASRPLLAQEIAIDLAPAAFPSQAIARTLLHHVPVLLQCIEADGDGRYDLYLPRSYAASVGAYLFDLARAYGRAHEAALDLGQASA